MRNHYLLGLGGALLAVTALSAAACAATVYPDPVPIVRTAEVKAASVDVTVWNVQFAVDIEVADCAVGQSTTPIQHPGNASLTPIKAVTAPLGGAAVSSKLVLNI